VSAQIVRAVHNEAWQFNFHLLLEVLGQGLAKDGGVVEVILEAVFGQSALEVVCNPECDVIILNPSHVVSFSGRTRLYLSRRDS